MKSKPSIIRTAISPTNFAEGLYGTAQDNNLLQTSGRYRTLPVLSSKLSDAEASAFGRVLKSADLADKINILNEQYPELSTQATPLWRHSWAAEQDRPADGFSL